MGFRLVQKRKGALQTRICGSLQHPNRRTNNYHHEQGFGHDQNEKHFHRMADGLFRVEPSQQEEGLYRNSIHRTGQKQREESYLS